MALDISAGVGEPRRRNRFVMFPRGCAACDRDQSSERVGRRRNCGLGNAIPLSSKRVDKSEHERFDATLRMENKGPLALVRYRSDAFVASRTRRSIDELSLNSYVLYRELSGGAWFEAGTDFVPR